MVRLYAYFRRLLAFIFGKFGVLTGLLIRGWNNKKAAYESYSQVLKWNNVDWEKVTWEKVTHLWKSGIETASAAGLDAQSTGTMPKHHTECSKMNS